MYQVENIPYRYTEKEIKKLLNSIIVISDTREQANRHITDYLEAKGVPWIKKALDFGDYSFMLPAQPELGILKDIYFTKKIVIERKAHLEELSGNFAQERGRFEAELIRSFNSRFILLIESGYYQDIVKHNYETQYNAKSFVGTLFSFCHRYNIHLAFVSGQFSGNYIYHCFYYWLREFIRT